jgi:hypothetical protein
VRIMKHGVLPLVLLLDHEVQFVEVVSGGKTLFHEPLLEECRRIPR